MTARELAHRVIDDILLGPENTRLLRIEFMLSAALAEAEKTGISFGEVEAAVKCQEHCMEVKEEASAEAFEEAAKIAEGHFGLDTVCPEYIARLIRRRAGEGK